MVYLQSISCHFTVYFLSFYSLFPVILQSISCHYASAEIEFIDVKGSLQEQMEKETRDMARKKIIARGLNPESLTLKVSRTQLLVSYREMPSFSNRGPHCKKEEETARPVNYLKI